MDKDEHLELMEKRNYAVVKSNELVQKSRYALSITEQRAIAYLCSMIKPCIATPTTRNVPYQLEYEFNIWDYAKVCGLTSDGGQLYEETKSLLKGLKQKVMWLELPDGTEVTVCWLAKVWTNKRSGIVKVKLDEDLAPYLFNLQEQFTIYGLINILAMKSQYSIRIYELLKSHAYKKMVTYEVNELKKRLMIDDVKGYVKYNNFKARILDPATAEINKYTDLSISYEQITKGRKVVKIKFLIAKKDMMDRLVSNASANDEIESSNLHTENLNETSL